MYPRILEKELLRLKGLFKVVTITGPRQSGKTTLCRMAFPHYQYVNLEDEAVVNELEMNRKSFVEHHYKGVIIDEVQRIPEILNTIQVVADSHPDANIILTGSNNLQLSNKVTQSLAGRTAMLTLLPLAVAELNDRDRALDDFEIMFRGFYPAVWANGIPANDIYRQYYNTYVQRDILQLMNVRRLNEFRKFLVISASRVGCEFNASSISNELGVSLPTIAEWMNVLEASYVAFRLQPFYRNISKRLVKTPKVYFYDVGFVCYLLGINNVHQLETHPLRGQIFENMVVTEFLKHRFNHGRDNNLFFFRDRSGNEVDLVLDYSLQTLQAFEVKLSAVVHHDFYKSLNYFRSLFAEETRDTLIVNTGAKNSETPFVGHINYRDIETTLQEDLP